MNKIGLHSGYWRGTSLEDQWYDIMDADVKAGLDVMEIGPIVALSLSKKERQDFKKALADKGLLINFNGGLNETNDIAVDDPAIRQAGIDFSKAALEAMAEMGGKNWSGINYSAWLRHPGGPLTPDMKKHYFDLSVASMKQIIKTAEDVGMTYGYEVVNRFEQFIFNTAEGGVEYCEAVGSPAAGLLIDTFHMNIEEDSIPEAIKYTMAKGRMAHFHVGESNRNVPGLKKTDMDWPAIFGAVKESGYQGYISMEPFVQMGSAGSENIRVWRDLGPRDVEARIQNVKIGADFIRAGLQ
ncbi:MAG: sugar phosphate isomerase/epimerase family protein [Christensenellales bacterium]|jgi:D-psicose/D-tagatose/L-ribulose 3-epimerase